MLLGSGTGRLPILAALMGVPHVLAVEKEPESFARSVLALQRLRQGMVPGQLLGIRWWSI